MQAQHWGTGLIDSCTGKGHMRTNEPWLEQGRISMQHSAAVFQSGGEPLQAETRRHPGINCWALEPSRQRAGLWSALAFLCLTQSSLTLSGHPSPRPTSKGENASTWARGAVWGEPESGCTQKALWGDICPGHQSDINAVCVHVRSRFILTFSGHHGRDAVQCTAVRSPSQSDGKKLWKNALSSSPFLLFSVSWYWQDSQASQCLSHASHLSVIIPANTWLRFESNIWPPTATVSATFDLLRDINRKSHWSRDTVSVIGWCRMWIISFKNSLRNAFHSLAPPYSGRRWLTNGALWALITGEALKATGCKSVSARLPSTSYLLPFAVDQGKLQVIILYGFICPAQRGEDTSMGFFFMAGSAHMSLRYTASTALPSPQPHRALA